MSYLTPLSFGHIKSNVTSSYILPQTQQPEIGDALPFDVTADDEVCASHLF